MSDQRVPLRPGDIVGFIMAGIATLIGVSLLVLIVGKIVLAVADAQPELLLTIVVVDGVVALVGLVLLISFITKNKIARALAVLLGKEI